MSLRVWRNEVRAYFSQRSLQELQCCLLGYLQEESFSGQVRGNHWKIFTEKQVIRPESSSSELMYNIGF